MLAAVGWGLGVGHEQDLLRLDDLTDAQQIAIGIDHREFPEAPGLVFEWDDSRDPGAG